MTAVGHGSVPITQLYAEAYTVPTESAEADGTLRWDRTTLVLARAHAGAREGIGYSYSHRGAAQLINETLAEFVMGSDALAPNQAYERMLMSVRNLGHPGIAGCAVSAVDASLWDLKAKLLDLSLVDVLGGVREEVPVYGSGGFTNYPLDKLCEQLGGWVEDGIRQVKMKVGAEPKDDSERVRAVREVIGPEAGLFVDANGAYHRKQALAQAECFAEQGVAWFEEPVSSNDVGGLRLMRDRGPPGMQIAAGEYAYRPLDFRRLLEAQAVDALQADATRCGGISGFLKAAALAEAFEVPLSAHTAPSLHRPLGCALGRVAHIEYFHDHVRIEQMLFDGAAKAAGGMLRPDFDRPGLGLEFKQTVASQYRDH